MLQGIYHNHLQPAEYNSYCQSNTIKNKNKKNLALSSLSKKQFWRTILAVQRQGSTDLNSFDPIQIKARYPIYI